MLKSGPGSYISLMIMGSLTPAHRTRWSRATERRQRKWLGAAGGEGTYAGRRVERTRPASRRCLKWSRAWKAAVPDHQLTIRATRWVTGCAWENGAWCAICNLKPATLAALQYRVLRGADTGPCGVSRTGRYTYDPGPVWRGRGGATSFQSTPAPPQAVARAMLATLSPLRALITVRRVTSGARLKLGVVGNVAGGVVFDLC